MANDTKNDNQFDYVNFGDQVVKLPKGMSNDEKLQALQKLDPDYKGYKELYLDIPGMDNVPSFPEYKKQLNQTKSQDEARANRTIGDKLIGAGETALTTGSALGSTVLAPFAYGLESIKDLWTGQPVADFEKSFGEIVQAGTYQPRTEAGQEYTRNLGDAIQESKIEGALGLPVLGSLRGTGMGIRQGVSKVGQGVSKAGETISKVLPKKEIAVGATDKPGLISKIIGMTTGTSGETIRTAFNTGMKGAKEETDAFLKGLQGNANPTSTVQKAKSALNQIKKAISLEYQGYKSKLTQDKTKLEFDDIDTALSDIAQSGKYEGQIVNPSTVKLQEKITKIVNDWKSLDAKKFHTPEGMDALKRRIGDLYDEVPPGTNERIVLNKVYDSIGNTIRKQAPIYDEMMSSYNQGKTLVREIEDTFALGEKKKVDTQFRKLSSILRNNVNTNYGERFNLAQKLNELEPTLFPELAGQSLSSWTPRGIQGLAGSGNILYQMMSGLSGKGLLALGAQSPRLMGRTAFELGRGARGVKNMGQQIGDAINMPNIPTVSGPATSQGLTLPGGILGTTYPEEI